MAQNDDVNPSFTGALVYHTGQNSIPAGIYVWNGDNWTPAGDDCRELATPITLDAQVRAVLENRPITFSLNGQTFRCSLNRYEWYKTANTDGTGDFETTPFAVTVGSTTLPIDSFPPALAVYRVKVKVTSPYLPHLPLGTTSDESTELEIAVGGCPAKISATEWRFFMCHNLGADENADPFTPSYSLNGAYYKWGSKEFTGGANDGIIAGPDASGVDPVSSSGNYSWSWFASYNANAFYGDDSGGMDVKVKSSFDPCPEDYRVPSLQEWADVVSYNNKGTWVTGSPVAVSGRKFGDFLFLPATGYLSYTSTGALSGRGSNSFYWSTRKNGASAYSLYFDSGNANGNDSYSPRVHGFPVRCIAK